MPPRTGAPPPPPSGGWRGRVRRAAPLLGVLAFAVVAAVILLPDARDGLPLAPGSTGPDGTRALVEVLRELGREVDVVAPDAPGDAPVILLLVDQLTPDERAALERRVEDGARVVVTDPTSPLAPPTIGGSLLLAASDPDCELPALARVGAVQSSGALFEVPEDATGCFRQGGGAWLVSDPRGQGEIIATGSAGFLQNNALGAADHAVLAVHLLAPGSAGRVEIIAPIVMTEEAVSSGRGAEGGAGRSTDQRTLGDLVPPGVRAALWQLLLGFLVLVAWRARRLGQPLVDRSPVKLAGSDLTAAVGSLLNRHDAHGDALRRIAADTRRRLAGHLDLPDTSDLDELCAQIAARTSYDAQTLARILDPPPPRDEAGLLAAVTALDDIVQAVQSQLASTLEEPDVH